MRSLCAVLTGALVCGSTAVAASPQVAAQTRARIAQRAIVERYLSAMRDARYDDAYRMLDAAERTYYRNAKNFGSIYTADAYRVIAFAPAGERGDDATGRVFFLRETARFRDHAHDVDLTVTATVPVGVVPEAGRWRIRDPGHPWRAFPSHALTSLYGVTVSVKKVSFFARRIETVVTFVNAGAKFITVLPYGKSILHDASGHAYRIIETRDWSLTDKTLFEGLRLAPGAQYTGMLAFTCPALDDSQRTYALTVSPLLVDGADQPFSIRIDALAAGAPANG